MSRWIDAEYCEDFFDRWESRVKNADPVTIDVVQNTRTLLRDAPSIDIVFCRDCEYKRLYDEGDTKYYYCALEDRPNRQWSVDDTDFCSYGERREP